MNEYPFRHSIDEIDKIFHEPARLLIAAYLLAVKSADFIFLMQQTGLTSGNLSSHIARMEDVGYLHVEKKFVRKRSQTIVKLTPKGRAAFKEYKKIMKSFLEEES